MEVYKKNPDYLKGPYAQFFSQYTVKSNAQDYGFTDAIGKICIASNDPTLKKTIQDNKWFDDDYAKDNSIFAPLTRSDSVNLNEAFVLKAMVSIELASLNKFAEYYRMLAWEQIFKAAMYACFTKGEDVCPYFSNNCPYELSEIYKNSDILSGDGLLSTLATPSVSVFKERIELSSIALQFPEIVKDFNTFSSSLEIMVPSSNENCQNLPIEIPGSKTVSLFSHVVSVQSNTPRPAVLSVSKTAFSNIKSNLYTGEFYGGLAIQNSDSTESFIVMNGLLFCSSASSNTVEITDIRQPPTKELLTKNLINFQLALIEAEFRLNFARYFDSGKDNKALICRYLLWLGGAVGQTSATTKLSTDVDSDALQARALYLAKIAAQTETVGMLVPYLTYSAYKDAITGVQNVIQTASTQITNFQAQIRVRKAEERAIERKKQLNENIIKSGKQISDYIAAQAQYEEAMSDHYNSVISMTEKELDSLSKQKDVIKKKLGCQRTAVNDEIEKYKDAVADWQKNETIKAALDIASNLFALGFAIAIPSEAVKALKDLGEMVGRLQKVVKVFDAIIKTYRSFKTLPKDPAALVHALNDVPLKGLDLLSSLEWSEMKVNMDKTLDSGPSISAKTRLSAAFAILVLRGQALVEVQNTIQAKLALLASAYSNKHVHNDQVKHLKDITVKFNTDPKHLDRSSIDLVGLSSKLVLFQRQMLATMASTLEIQGRALQYEYLEPPASVPSFSFLDLQVGVLSQAQSILRGLTVQPMPQAQPEPIVYEIHGVQPGSLVDGNSYTFSIPVNSREFASYNYVRVDKVEAEIGGIRSTKSGKYYAELKFNGDPFLDRDFNGKILTFETLSHNYSYLYNVSSSSHCKNLLQKVDKSQECIVAQQSYTHYGAAADAYFGVYVSKITPFSSWTIALPPTSSNENITFDNCPRGVTVRLTFHLYAQLKETYLSTEERIRKVAILRTRNLDLSPDMMDAMSLSEPLMQSSPNVSASDVLNKMTNKSVVYGCDVVFSLSSSKVNDNLYDQYKDRQGNPDFLRDTGKIEKEFTNSQGRKSKTIFDFHFKAPKLQFILNNSAYATVVFPIQSGLYEYQLCINGSWETWDKADIKESDNYSVQGEIPMSFLQGEVSTKWNISLKLNGGRFSSQNFRPGTSNPNMNDALMKYFTQDLPKGYELYNLGTLDTKDITLLPSLKPSKFRLNVYHTESNRDILQVLIATTGALAKEAALQLSEPFPTMFESSLIISSKIFFSDVVPASFGKVNSLKIAGVELSGNLNQWSTQATAGLISGHYPPTKVGSYSHCTQGGCLNSEDYVAVPSDTATIDLQGMSFDCNGSNWGAKMSFDMNNEGYTFMYGFRSQFCGIFGCGHWSSIYYNNYTVQVTVTMNADLEFTITGQGQDQQLQLATIPSTNPCIKGNVEPPAGACKCNDSELKQSFLKNLRSALTDNLTNMLKHDFPSISLFALKNILFPAKNIVDLKEAYVPGDAVVFGNIVIDPSP